jgi:Alr-MurF fusion protein
VASAAPRPSGAKGRRGTDHAQSQASPCLRQPEAGIPISVGAGSSRFICFFFICSRITFPIFYRNSHTTVMSGFKYTLAQIAEMIGPDAQIIGQATDVALAEVEFDTRLIHDAATTLFMAIKGENRDGHRFLQQAFEKGVCHFLLSEADRLPTGACGILVPDTVVALQAFAKSHRDRFPRCRVVAITGSNGKTTVKEWLVTLLSGLFAVYKSPGSYNSQIGVPLSLLGIEADHEIAIIEAGISKKGEMARLERIIRPDIGILTHFGDAHAEGFASPAEKLQEKLQLFQHTKLLIADVEDETMLDALVAFTKTHPQALFTLGLNHDVWTSYLEDIHSDATGSSALLQTRDTAIKLSLPIPGEAALHNAALAVVAAKQIGEEWNDFEYADFTDRIALLRPVSMRMEMITDNPEITIINDAYNADLSSVKNALSLIATAHYHTARTLILTDIDHQGSAQERVQKAILDMAVMALGADNIVVVGPVFDMMLRDVPWIASYPSTEAFIEAFDYERFRNRTVLLKGARRFELDRLIPYLSRRATATWFKINMNALAHNYRQLRARVPKTTRTMAMVKAFAYGSGAWEIAQAVVREGVDELAVAYTSEGIMLRTRGIHVPIMVMNADLQSIAQLFRFDLVPEVYNLDFLRSYIAEGRQQGKSSFPVHIKVDTGMGRLGFDWQAAAELVAFLKAEPMVVVQSVLSHLASADALDQDAFTHLQAQRFQHFYAELGAAVSFETLPLRHLCNTAGMLRFPEYALDMVRLGIGLYGIPPFEEADIDLQEIGSIHTVVTQVHEYAAATPIGYGCSESRDYPTRIATLPIGYADGIRRSLSNGKGRFLIRGQRAPVIGRVCMDMLMLDVTHVAGAQAGDEVVLMGGQGADFISVKEIAALCDTISYEILTGISQRVRRVYVRE